MIIYALNPHLAKAQQLASLTSARLGELEYRHFPDTETYIRINTDPSGETVWVLAQLCPPNLLFLDYYLLCAALKEQGAKTVGLIAGYLPYMRQDKAFKPGESITSRLFCQLLSTGIDRLVTVDPHLHRTAKLESLFSIPTTTLSSAPAISKWIQDNVENPVIVGPDSESRQWVSKIAKLGNVPYLVHSKTRIGDFEVKVEKGNYTDYIDRQPILVDDIISTGKTMGNTVKNLIEAGMRPPIIIGVHAIFSGDAFNLLQKSGASKIITCNTIEHDSNEIDVLPVIAGAISSRDK